MNLAAIYFLAVVLITISLAWAMGKVVPGKGRSLAITSAGLFVPVIIMIIAYVRLQEIPAYPRGGDAGAMLVAATAMTVASTLPFSFGAAVAVGLVGKWRRRRV
jgi:hypothetical protein